jgi:hypothetical protein
VDKPVENPALDFLDEEFPKAYRHFLPSALRRAYATANRLIEAEPSLQTPGGRIQHGDLIAHAAEWEVMRLVEGGSLPFDFTWEEFARPTGRHLVVWTQRGRLTISQVPDAEKKPRSAEFRDNYAMSNQPFLFSFMQEEIEDAFGRRHILLIHGYQELTFSHLTIPHASANRHIAISANLMTVPHVATPEPAKEEGPTQAPEPEATENLRRIIRDTSND